MGYVGYHYFGLKKDLFLCLIFRASVISADFLCSFQKYLL